MIKQIKSIKILDVVIKVIYNIKENFKIKSKSLFFSSSI